jgi:hypothetical protein
MARTALKVLILDAVLLLAEFEIIQDMQNRIQCALGSPLYGQSCMVRGSPSFSYSLLTQSFSMVVGGKYVQSPPTISWVQLIAYFLVAINVWYGYTVFASRRAPEDQQGNSQPTATSP